MTNDSGSGPSMMQKALFTTMPALLLVLNLLVFGSFAVYSENPGEFLVTYADALQMYVLPGLVLFIAVSLLSLILTEGVRLLFNILIILIAVMTYIHGSLLLWDTGVLDGRALEFSNIWYGFIDGVIWVMLGWAAFRYRSWLAEHGWRICAVLILFQAIGLFANLYMRDSEAASKIYVFPPELAQFSTESNVIHLVLDGFQASIFEEMLTQQPELRKQLSGFTFFRDATAPSDVTYLSVPATLTGKVFTNQQPISEYHEQTLGGENLYSFMAANDFAVDVVTPLWWNKPNPLFSSYYRIPKPYADKDGALLSTTLLLIDISVFRQMPYFLKSRIYRDGTWLLSGSLVSEPEQQFSHFAHSAFMADLLNRMTVEPIDPRYKFIHLISPHAPFVSTPDCGFSGAELAYDKLAFTTQSRCILEYVSAFVRELKQLGIYDSSMLIIHGDHGGGVGFAMTREDGSQSSSAEVLHRMWGNPLPLVLVKPPLSTGDLKTSDRFVQLQDVPATVADLLDIPGEFPGRSMFDPDADTETVRLYFNSTIHRNDAAAKDSFDNFSRYEISGSIYNEESWSEAESFAAETTDDEGIYVWDTALTFGNKGTFRPFQSGGWIVTLAKDVTWTQGNTAGLSIRFDEPGGPVQMRAKIKPLIAPGKLDRQRVILFVGDEKVTEWEATENRFHIVEVDIPGELISADDNTEIRFELPDAASPLSLQTGKDGRSLGLAFMSIVFEQTVEPELTPGPDPDQEQ